MDSSASRICGDIPCLTESSCCRSSVHIVMTFSHVEPKARSSIDIEYVRPGVRQLAGLQFAGLHNSSSSNSSSGCGNHSKQDRGVSSRVHAMQGSRGCVQQEAEALKVVPQTAITASASCCRHAISSGSSHRVGLTANATTTPEMIASPLHV